MTNHQSTSELPGDRHARSRGVILLIVLWAVAMMSVVVVALGSLAQKSLVGERVEAERMETAFALRAGLELGKAFILTQTAEEQVFLDGTPFSSAIGEGRVVSVSVRDAAGVVDLNRADPALIESVAIASGMAAGDASTLSAKIIELRKNAGGDARSDTERQADDSKASDSGTPPAKAPEQQPAGDVAAEKPVFPAIFSTPAQIKGILDTPGSNIDKFLSLVGLYSATGMINPFAAPETILKAVPEITPRDISSILAARQSRQWKNDPKIAEMLERLKKYLAADEPRVFIIEARLIKGRGVIEGAKAGAVVITGNGKGMPFQTLALSW
jgi:type II secretory pathway component PulK